MTLHFRGNSPQDLVSFMNRAIEQRRKPRRAKFLKNTFYSSFMVAAENALIDSIVQDFPFQSGVGTSSQEIKEVLGTVFTKDFVDHAMNDQVFDDLKGISTKGASATNAVESDKSSALMQKAIGIAKKGYPNDSNVIEKIHYLDHVEKLLSPLAYSDFIVEMNDAISILPRELEDWKTKSTMPISSKTLKWANRWFPSPGTVQ